LHKNFRYLEDWMSTLWKGSGGPWTVSIAAADALQSIKDTADFVCDGTNDSVQFQAANDSFSNSHGRIVLSEGSFTLGSTEVNLASGVTLQGMGAGSTYVNGTASTMMFDVASNSSINDIYFDQLTNGGGCVDIVGGQGSSIKNCQFENSDSTGFMVRHSAGGHLTIQGNFFDGNGDGITSSGNGGRLINITNNDFLATNRCIYFPAADIYSMHIIGNNFNSSEDWGVYIDASNGVIIANNDFASCGQTSNGALWLNTALGTITGNKFDSTRNGPDVHINASRDVTVVGNTSETAFKDGLLLDASSTCVVADNVWQLDGHDTPNTYDGIRLSGNSDSNHISGNILTGTDSRYGINVSANTCDNNLVENNYLSGTFSTAEYNDAGTGTKFGIEGDKWNLGEESGRTNDRYVKWDGTDFVLDTATPAAHTIASHSDTTGTGAELDTLTDGSDSDSLHDHATYLKLDGSRPMPGALDVDQASTSGAAPVITLDQADVDEDFFKFVGTSDTNVDRALVDAVDFSTPGAIVGWLKINVQDDQGTNPITDGDYYIPFYAVPTT